MSRSTARADADASSITTATVVNQSPQSDGYQRGSDDLRGRYTSIPTNEHRASSNLATTATKVFPSEPDGPRPQIYQPLGTVGTLRIWSLEMMALVLSAAALLTIVAVLYKLDGELQPELAYDLNVNTLIAIFSVMLRATLLFVMAEAEIEAVIINGLIFDAADSTFKSMFTCTTGNCTFDATAGSRKTCTISIATLKNAGCVSSENDTHSGAVKRGCGDLYESILYANADIDFAAANCTVHSCLRSYNEAVVNGILKERVVSSAPTQNASNVLKEEGRRNRTRAYHGFVKPCVIDGKWYDELNISKATRDEIWVSWRTRDGIRGAPRQCLRAIDHSHYWTAMLFQQESLPGSCRLWYEDDHGPLDPTVNPIDTDRMVIDCDDRWWLDALHRSGNATFESISAAIDSMTTSLTNHMRIRGENWQGTGSGFVTGSVMQAAICVQVDWFWLAYPATLLCITTILIAIACVQSYQSRERQPVWKSAILPLLFYNVETEQRRKYAQQQDRGDWVPLLQLSALEKLASQTVARFETRVGDVGFVVGGEDEKEANSSGQ
ncbi:hypothetical protein CMUS01_09616 [Colletotrichum musicola]|uniref:Transmembrane protein n=1 Tax=Colletotrichum musicola TaxID=2175873 RepID=A0A8H6K6K0_9PEZI|nr:hypothetical protein CMUS01_09616 [Colletotrichum musicola]